MRKFTGFTAKTPERLMLDAGVFFKNYDLSKTYAENKSAGNLVCATQGGGNFSAVPTVRKIKVDGLPDNTKGLAANDEWVATLALNMLESDAETAKLALGAAAVTDAAEAGVTGYKKVTGKGDFTDDDYLDNITWVGCLRGSDQPVIIVLYNALSEGGLQWQMQDKTETITACTLTANYAPVDDTTDKPPFDILYPPLRSQGV